MNNADRQYITTMRQLLNDGVYRVGRNGHATRAMFGHQMRFNLSEGLPLLTTKRVHFKSIAVELLWFLRGDSNTQFLHDHGVTIWDEWADENGDLGPVYGSQWRRWLGPTNDPSGGDIRVVDQIANVLKSLRDDPFGRRHVVTAWNPAEVDNMALPPCHMMFQFFVRPGDPVDIGPRYLDLQMYQRSADWFLGVPFNIASYALLLQLVAREVGYMPGEFVHTFGDYHLYENHIAAAKEQLWRKGADQLPHVRIRHGAGDLFNLKWDDLVLVGYEPMPAIKAEVAV